MERNLKKLKHKKELAERDAAFCKALYEHDVGRAIDIMATPTPSLMEVIYDKNDNHEQELEHI